MSMSASIEKREEWWYDREKWWEGIDPEQADVMNELMSMVDEGLLHFGVNENAEMTFWPTPMGCEVLGMEAALP